MNNEVFISFIVRTLPDARGIIFVKTEKEASEIFYILEEKLDDFVIRKSFKYLYFHLINGNLIYILIDDGRHKESYCGINGNFFVLGKGFSWENLPIDIQAFMCQKKLLFIYSIEEDKLFTRDKNLVLTPR